jgi:hypothetical protein
MPAGPNILVATPCYGGLLTHVYLHSILQLSPWASSRGVRIRVWTAVDSLVTRARNAIVASFLDLPDATHLMFIDADTGFDGQQLGRLLDFDEDIVAGMYPLKDIDWAQAARRCAPSFRAPNQEQLREAGLHFVGVPLRAGEREERDGFVTAEYAGTGFMLVKRAAILRMSAAYPETHYQNTHTYPAPPTVSENHYALFDSTIDPDTRTYLSEDYAFCKRWRAIGGKVWLDTRSRLRHVGAYEFQGTPILESVTAGKAVA